MLPIALAALCNLAQAAPQVFSILDASGQPVARAAVSVMVKGVHPTATPGQIAAMGQRSRAFEPTLLVIQTGTLVNFPNFDTVRHHVYSFSPTKSFEIKLYAGTPTAPILFDKPGTATLGCNIHDKMISHIHVVDTPYFGLTDTTGKIVIDIPPGEHKAQVWHEAMQEKVPPMVVAFKTGGPLIVRLAR